MSLNKIICGDSSKILKDFQNNYIDLTITSPPYDYELNIRKYEKIGWNEKVFKDILNELFRITKPGGIVVWIVNDSTKNGTESLYSFKQALYFKEIGFNVHDTMIYAKNNPIPLTHNRYEQQFEYMFVFSKGKPKTFNPLMRENKNFGKKNAGTIRQTGEELSKKHKEGKVKEKSYRYNIWYYSVGYGKTAKDKIAFAHPAVFPEQLAEDCILSWSNEKDIILDPMCGSGTVPLMAKKINRQYIGIDISEKYCNIAKERLKNVSL